MTAQSPPLSRLGEDRLQPAIVNNDEQNNGMAQQ